MVHKRQEMSALLDRCRRLLRLLSSCMPLHKGKFLGAQGHPRAFIKYAPALNPLWTPLDDLFGYGRVRDPSIAWGMKMAPFGIDVTKEL